MTLLGLFGALRSMLAMLALFAEAIVGIFISTRAVCRSVSLLRGLQQGAEAEEPVFEIMLAVVITFRQRQQSLGSGLIQKIIEVLACPTEVLEAGHADAEDGVAEFFKTALVFAEAIVKFGRIGGRISVSPGAGDDEQGAHGAQYLKRDVLHAGAGGVDFHALELADGRFCEQTGVPRFGAVDDVDGAHGSCIMDGRSRLGASHIGVCHSSRPEKG